MITSNFKNPDLSTPKSEPLFSLDVEDTIGGVITMVLVVFALAAIAIVVYSTIYPLGTLTGQLSPSLEQSLPIQSFPQVRASINDKSAHLRQSAQR